MQPEILLLDEPFGTLDEATREEQQTMLLNLRDENQRDREKGKRPPYSIVLVTHELNEAIYVADRVVGLSRHWLWQKEPGLTEHPGATLVYDAATPFSPHDLCGRLEHFQAKRAEIRQAAFGSGSLPRQVRSLLEGVSERNHIIRSRISSLPWSLFGRPSWLRSTSRLAFVATFSVRGANLNGHHRPRGSKPCLSTKVTRPTIENTSASCPM